MGRLSYLALELQSPCDQQDPPYGSCADRLQVWVRHWIKLSESCVDIKRSGLLSLAACSCLLLCVGAIRCATNWINLLIQLRRKPEKKSVCWSGCKQTCVTAGVCRSLWLGWGEDRVASLVSSKVFEFLQSFEDNQILP